MPRWLRNAAVGLATLVGASRPAPANVAVVIPQPVVKEIPDASLRDVAVAVYDSLRPVIYYNPELMRRFSPALDSFFMAHEYAHIALHHTRASALRAGPGIRDHLLQAKELEADCLAARRLGETHRDATLAAVRFFSRMGDARFDMEHPTGSERARNILSCMPK
ncbi:MAG TPA: hypothetical protein VEI47_05050 [Gemmatimonadales bacterium]|nr:hypothetical protein [Gemmatimonadales bacterium]